MYEDRDQKVRELTQVTESIMFDNKKILNENKLSFLEVFSLGKS